MINPQKPVINPIKNCNRFTALIYIYIYIIINIIYNTYYIYILFILYNIYYIYYIYKIYIHAHTTQTHTHIHQTCREEPAAVTQTPQMDTLHTRAEIPGSASTSFCSSSINYTLGGAKRNDLVGAVEWNREKSVPGQL